MHMYIHIICSYSKSKKRSEENNGCERNNNVTNTRVYVCMCVCERVKGKRKFVSIQPFKIQFMDVSCISYPSLFIY